MNQPVHHVDDTASLPMFEERRRIVAVAQQRLRAARLLLERADLSGVDFGKSAWPPREEQGN